MCWSVDKVLCKRFLGEETQNFDSGSELFLFPDHSLGLTFDPV